MRPVLTSLLALFTATVAHAGPGYIPVQGMLADDVGTAIDGTVDLTFTLYSDGSGSTSLWTDTVTIDVVDGRFATELGSNTPLDLDTFASFPTVHLEIQVGTDTAMPLVPLDHVPYAAHAERAADADLLGGLSLSAIRAEIPTASDIEAGAQAAAFDTESELTTLLDDNYVAAGYVPDWTDLTNIPSGFADGVDDNTQLSQATVEAYAEGVAYNTEAELTALLDDNYKAATYLPAWSELTGMPSGFSDGVDNNTTYSAGTGLNMSGTTLSVDSGSWTAPALVSGWSNYSSTYNQVGYRKDSNGFVHLRGLTRLTASDGNATIADLPVSNVTLFTLPTGYRPSRRELHVCNTHDWYNCRIDVYSNGNVVLHTGKSGWMSLDGITFYAGN